MQLVSSHTHPSRRGGCLLLHRLDLGPRLTTALFAGSVLALKQAEFPSRFTLKEEQGLLLATIASN